MKVEELLKLLGLDEKFQEIIEITKFREGLKKIKFNSWVLLDLDNTIHRHVCTLERDEWFDTLFSHAEKQGIDKTIAAPAIISIYHAIQSFVQTTPIEPTTAKIISTLQDVGIPVIGLTSRGYGIREQTIRQLTDISIDFSRNSIVPDNYELGSFGGIIYCSGENKGERFNEVKKYIKEKTGCEPWHVALWDDKKEHTEKVKAVLKKEGTSFSGLRYGFCDGEKANVNMKEATIQLAHVWPWLPSKIKQDILMLKLLPETPQNTTIPEEYMKAYYPPLQADTPGSFLSNLSGSPCLELPERPKSAFSFFDRPRPVPGVNLKTKAVLLSRKRSVEELYTETDIADAPPDPSAKCFCPNGIRSAR